jgi:hypothetical protein
MDIMSETNIPKHHDLLSSLNTILDLTHILIKDDALTSQHKDMVGNIQKEGFELSSKIHEIFDIPVNDLDLSIDNTHSVSFPDDDTPHGDENLIASQPDKIPDENILKELIRLARQGAYSEIKNMIEQIKTKQSEFISFIRYLEQLLKQFQFKEMIDWINSSKKNKD